MTPLRVFIGYDPREAVAYHVLVHSIIRHASHPVSITPLALRHLSDIYTRARDPKQSTEFTYTRFLVPYLSGYEGVSIYLDCDMLARVDLWELVMAPFPRPRSHLWGAMELREPTVWVVKHDYVPRTSTKMDGQAQTAYPRKNWSSLMVFNNARCRTLTPEYVNTASPAALHRFAWADGDDEGLAANVGALPLEWNYLVGEDNQSKEPPKIVHWTNGGPWLEAYRDAEYAQEWFDELVLPFSSGPPFSVSVGVR